MTMAGRGRPEGACVGGPVCGESGPLCGRTGGEGTAGQLPLSLPRARNQGVVPRLHTLCVIYRNLIQGSVQLKLVKRNPRFEVKPGCQQVKDLRERRSGVDETVSGFGKLSGKDRHSLAEHRDSELPRAPPFLTPGDSRAGGRALSSQTQRLLDLWKDDPHGA
ncbi:unnamed protein product [Rangifer tarandus platyrhynchus]|uniref:Uncharacterized protein n=3 Tax=Rangifer tarandus platyrhynchus TaxID=3082113 RepID=A0ABN8ZCH8_RANTA|nr:unnamed protein product [Rangifer tarandus platyrhynchus]CAI9706015.1 unnamed protein product [Rangifer tarandus platyrhynchus]